MKTEKKSKKSMPHYLMQKNSKNDSMDDSEINNYEVDQDFISERDWRKGANVKEYIFSWFTRKIYAELYFAWCKDCNETFSAESAKYFRDELLIRNNKDLKGFNFRSMRISKNFLWSFVGNLSPGAIKKVDLRDNMVSDVCMHNIKSLISAKGVEYLNLASNMISTEGWKIVQLEIMQSQTLKYLNFGVLEGSFRRNNFSGEGGIILARILLRNKSIETLIWQDNEWGEDSGAKIGASWIQNKTLKKLVWRDNKIQNKGARSIIENAGSLTSLDLANNEVSPEVCYDWKNWITSSKKLKEIVWDGNNIGVKGINFIVDALGTSSNIRYLSLKNTSISVQGISILARGLLNNRYLEILDIGSNSINYESFVLICDALNSNKIKCLKCKNNLLGDEAMKYFADTILSKDTTSNWSAFDFSSCKIYDQGLIYLLNELASNEIITWINWRDNYFSHEIDFVILSFWEKNKHITHLDLNKNRLSFQCIQKINKIIKRNIKWLNDKEPNKLWVELHSLKYENAKWNELKDTLKNIENDNKKWKSNKLELKQDYEFFKNSCEEKAYETEKIMEKHKQLLELRKREWEEQKEIYEKTKQDSLEKLAQWTELYENSLKRKNEWIEEKERWKQEKIDIQVEGTKKISDWNAEIENNKKLDIEYMKEIKATNTEWELLEKQIKEKEAE